MEGRVKVKGEEQSVGGVSEGGARQRGDAG